MLKSLGKADILSGSMSVGEGEIAYNCLYQLNGKKVYGLYQPKDTVTIISKICLNESECLPDSVFNDLFFPDFFYIAYPIHPIKLYKDPLKEGYYYLYIFGQNYDNISLIVDVRNYYTYMSKFIFYKGKFLKRIVVSEHILEYFDWTCPRFIGF